MFLWFFRLFWAFSTSLWTFGITIRIMAFSFRFFFIVLYCSLCNGDIWCSFKKSKSICIFLNGCCWANFFRMIFVKSIVVLKFSNTETILQFRFKSWNLDQFQIRWLKNNVIEIEIAASNPLMFNHLSWTDGQCDENSTGCLILIFSGQFNSKWNLYWRWLKWIGLKVTTG